MSGEQKITWWHEDEPPFLFGPRPYNVQSGPNGIPRVTMTVPRKVGDYDKADLEVIVTEFGDGEIDYEVRCLCPACFEVHENFEVVEKVVDVNVYGKPEPGVYYVRFWSEQYGGYFEPPDYDAGLEIAE